VIAELRGEGLLVGLRAVVPSADLVDELRAEKMITVAAGDNVVRLLPPLIVSEDEVAEAVRRIERACARIAKAQERPQKREAGGWPPPAPATSSTLPTSLRKSCAG